MVQVLLHYFSVLLDEVKKSWFKKKSVTTQNQNCWLYLTLYLLAAVLLSACQADAPAGKEAPPEASKTPVLLLGSQLTIDDRIAPTQLFSHLLEQRLRQEAPYYQIVNAGIARETPGQLSNRWSQLKALDPALVIMELPSDLDAMTDQQSIHDLLDTILQTQAVPTILLWTRPALGQPLPLQLAEKFQVSIIEIPIKNEEWDAPDALHQQIATQLWPTLRHKLQNRSPQ
jgi:hypothetical protein